MKRLLGHNRSANIALGLASISLLLFGAHILVQLLDRSGLMQGWLNWFVSRLDPNAEGNLPTAYNVALLLAVAGAILRLAHRFRWRFDWASLAAVALYLAVDEWFQLHERLTLPFRRLLGEPTGVLYYAWVIPATVAVLVLGLAYWKFFISLPRHTRKIIGVAVAVYLAGGIGGDLLAAGLNLDYGSLAYSLTAATEELLEWTGLTILLYGLLRFPEK